MGGVASSPSVGCERPRDGEPGRKATYQGIGRRAVPLGLSAFVAEAQSSPAPAQPIDERRLLRWGARICASAIPRHHLKR